MGVQSVGHRRRQVQLMDLLSHLPRDEGNGRLHFRHHPLGLSHPLHACLTEPFVLGNGANRVNLCADICRNALAVSAHASLSIDTVVGLAEVTDALGDLLSLGTDALELLARRLRVLCELLQACGCLWGAT